MYLSFNYTLEVMKNTTYVENVLSLIDWLIDWLIDLILQRKKTRFA